MSIPNYPNPSIPDFTKHTRFSYTQNPDGTFSSSESQQNSQDSRQGVLAQHSVRSLQGSEFNEKLTNLCHSIYSHSTENITNRGSTLALQKEMLERTVKSLNDITLSELSVDLVYRPLEDEINTEIQNLIDDETISNLHKNNKKINNNIRIKTFEKLKLELTGKKYKTLKANYEMMKGKNRLIKILQAAKITSGITADTIITAVRDAGFANVVKKFLQPVTNNPKSFAALKRIPATIPESPLSLSKYSSLSSLNESFFHEPSHLKPNPLTRGSSFQSHPKSIAPPVVPQRQTTPGSSIREQDPPLPPPPLPEHAL